MRSVYGMGWLVGVLLSAVSLSSMAYDAGDVILRAGAASVEPQESSSGVVELGAGSDQQLGITATYMFTHNWGIELLASTPFTHDVDLVPGETVGTIKHLPPTISAQYYFDTGTGLTPYVGAGINYFMVLESKMTSYGTSTFGTSRLDVGDSIGLSLSAGLDYRLTDNLVLNAAVWKIDVSTTADVKGVAKVDVDIDPMVYMVGIGYKF